MKQQLASCVLVGLLALIFSAVVLAVPEGPDSIVRGNSSRANLAVGGTVQQAEAGNTTSLVVSTTTVSRRWQGFYGNVSGGILLDDSDENSLYSWGLVRPDGEVYASNHSSVDWTNIDCVNFSSDVTTGEAHTLNLSTLNNYIGLGSVEEQASLDSFNGTFNLTLGDTGETLTVGTREFTNADNCSMAELFNASGHGSPKFRQVLLTDNASIVFASIISQDSNGFQNASNDFQMIVGVNGTVTGTVRSYFFYVELS